MKEPDIYDILIQKREDLLKVGDPFAVDFTLKEINILSDLTQLRALKLNTPFPVGFEPAENIFDCAGRIIQGHELYRVLEFCLWKNRVLIPQVTQVFKQLRRD